jgi:integrase
MPLTLFRRHKRNCTKGYQQNSRLYEPQTPKERKADCDCPIVVDGSLRLEAKRPQFVSTETSLWDKAKSIKSQWETWEALTNPNPDAVDQSPKTIADVVGAFMDFHGPRFKDWSPGFLRKFDSLFRYRIFPFCESEKIQFIGRFDDRALCNRFVASWRNMNPLHNRKLETGDTLPDVPLSYRTKVKELERVRYVFSWCKENGWLKFNHAKSIKLKYENPQPKFGLTPGEVDKVFAAIELLEDHGRLNQRNYLETITFCLVSRHTGLRINAVTNLDCSQLVPREQGAGYAIKIMEQRKTGWVRIPIPLTVYEALMRLPPKGEKDGTQYWFRTGEGSLTTAITVWRKRQTALFKKAQTGEFGGPFEHHATPHTWRHTFAISHLNAGTDIKAVSRWLGHKNVATTEAHYGHANSATNIASEIAYDESMRRQEQQKRDN